MKHTVLFLLFWTGLLIPHLHQPLLAQRSLRFEDQYLIAKHIPHSETESIEKLAAYIKAHTSTQLEKAQVIYSWTALNISYDYEGFNTKKYGDLSAEGVLQSRKAVCAGYSELFKELCLASGLKAIRINGYAKGYGYKQGDPFHTTNHAWNGVKIDGEWHLVDVTWGAASSETLNEKLKSTQSFSDYWFCTNPYEFIFQHLPQDPRYQNLPKPISKSQFIALPNIQSAPFELGFPGEKIFQRLITNLRRKVPTVYAPAFDLKVLAAPLSGVIRAKQPIKIKIHSPEDLSIAVINGEKWTYLTKEGDYYYGVITPKSGKLSIAYQLKSKKTGYFSILEYKVVNPS